MNDNVLIALDRIKFYARDALVTVTQVCPLVPRARACAAVRVCVSKQEQDTVNWTSAQAAHSTARHKN